MKKLLFIQPFFSYYRLPVIAELAHHFDVKVVTTINDHGVGFGSPSINNTKIGMHVEVTSKNIFGGKMIYQQNLLKIIKETKPNYVFACAAVRDLGFWNMLFYCYLKKIPLYSHGQGPYNKQKGFFIWLEYFILTSFSKRYVAYTPYSYDSFKYHGLSTSKVRVAHNSINNEYPVFPEEKNFAAKGILFIGRLRKGSDLDLLIDTVNELSKKYTEIICHIVGSGVLQSFYEEKYQELTCIKWHGEVFDQKLISDLSRECMIGCYPGSTGLSVIHYMSLSLPVVIHNNIKSHGPETSYVIDGKNGKLFDYFDKKNSLLHTLTELFSNIEELKSMSQSSFETYKNITNPSYAQQIINIIEE